MKKLIRTVTVLAVTTTPAALGVPLPIGETSLPGTTEADRPELAGVILEDTMTVYSFAGAAGEFVTGVINSLVVRSTLDGTLDFYWRIMFYEPVAIFRGVFLGDHPSF